ncbi:MAG: homocysteine S-methyltransferase family protein [bacterium]
MTQPANIIERFRGGRILFDGGLGTMLIARGLQPGMPPEEWNRTHPVDVRRVHTEYLEAGAEVIETNTFGGTPARMRSFGLGGAAELNNSAVRLANDAIDEFNRTRPRRGDTAQTNGPRFAALSIGPTGKMMPPVGEATEDEITAEFRAQFEGLDDTVDLVLIETIFDLREGFLALAAAKRTLDVPVAVTLTFNKNPRGFYTVMGNEAGGAMKELAREGSDIVGANCTLTSVEMVELARTLRESTDLPLLCQPNAGQPNIRGGVPVYDQTPREFADDVMKIFDLGINAVGGCCGTTPDFIREVSRLRAAGDSAGTTPTI